MICRSMDNVEIKNFSHSADGQGYGWRKNGCEAENSRDQVPDKYPDPSHTQTWGH